MTATDNLNPDSRTQRRVLGIVLLSYLIIVLDISIVITGLPEIQASLGFTPTGLSWVQNAYTLAFGGLLMLGARAGDLLGRKRVFLAGLSLFTLASLAVGLAPSPSWLIFARAVQGIGAAILAPATLSLLTSYFPEGEERTRALALYAAAAGFGASLGLVLGGLFAGLVSWRAGFFMNVPIGLALLLTARRILEETPHGQGGFDLLGTLSSTLGMTALVYGIVESAALGWQSAVTLTATLSGLALLLIFFILQARIANPMLPLRLFASRERVGAYLARMLFLGAMVSFFFFSTQFMQRVLGFSPVAAGVAFLPFSLVSLGASMAVPALTRRMGNSGVLLLSLASMSVGMFWLSQLTPDSHYVSAMALPLILIGLGNGAGLGPLTVSGVAGVAKEDTGAASGLVNVAHQLGGSLGLSLLVVVFAAASTPALSGLALFSHQITTALSGSAIMLLMAALVILSLHVYPQLAARRAIGQHD